MLSIFTLENLIRLIDILIVWFLFYELIQSARGTSLMTLIRGVLFVVVVRIIAWWLGLTTLVWILDQVINWGPIVLVILFQQEIRRFLETLGRRSMFASTPEASTEQHLINALDEAAQYFSQHRIGALIAIEQKTPLDDVAETGIPLDADVTSALLINTFIPNTPLHDGAAIIKNMRLEAAATVLPLSASQSISKALGTRHRAAIGLSENTDAVVLVVSEETGEVSIAYNGYLMRGLSQEEYVGFLQKQLIPETRESSTWLERFQGRGEHHRKGKD